jgi:hypothetical protein
LIVHAFHQRDRTDRDVEATKLKMTRILMTTPSIIYMTQVLMEYLNFQYLTFLYSNNEVNMCKTATVSLNIGIQVWNKR